METNNNLSKIKALLILFSFLTASLFIISMLLHISIIELEILIIDYAAHHLVITGLISLIVSIFCIRIYFSLNEAIKKRSYKKQLLNYKKQNAEESYMHGKSNLIDKKQIAELQFLNDDVLNSTEHAKYRENQLQKAVQIGNTIKHKVKIFFKDSYSLKHVETTIWHADEKHVSLKGGITLPVKSIYRVEI